MRYKDLMESAATPEAPIEEAFRGWAILPATMALYNKRVVDIKTAASTWDDTPTTILVCSKEEMDGRKRFCFVSSASDAYDHYAPKIGQGFDTYHDQTGAQKGTYVLMNVVVIHNGEIIKKANDTGINAKASLSVFK